MLRPAFPLRDIRENPRSNVRAWAAGDSAICSKNRKIVPYHGANPNTRNGARLRSPSPIMAPGFKHLFSLPLPCIPGCLLCPVAGLVNHVWNNQVLQEISYFSVRSANSSTTSFPGSLNPGNEVDSSSPLDPFHNYSGFPKETPELKFRLRFFFFFSFSHSLQLFN